jgi:uncharacterized protein (UPF0276 family)
MDQPIIMPSSPIPASAGIGLRFPHHRFVLEHQPDVPWYEVHPENYMAGGAPLRHLEAIRRDRPISLHAVGLSLGGTDPLDEAHLERLRRLIERIEPGLVSDHLSWSTVDRVYLADLLPLPYTEEALAIAAANIERAQTALGRRILIENPSTYLTFTHSTIAEGEFLATLAARTGCGILLDVNNLYVSASNHGWIAADYLAALPPAAIGEIHLAGHASRELADGQIVRIDDHGSPVCDAVWQLFREVLSRFGARPTLIEWDTAIPPFPMLAGEARQAQAVLDRFLPEARHADAA